MSRDFTASQYRQARLMSVTVPTYQTFSCAAFQSKSALAIECSLAERWVQSTSPARGLSRSLCSCDSRLSPATQSEKDKQLIISYAWPSTGPPRHTLLSWAACLQLLISDQMCDITQPRLTEILDRHPPSIDHSMSENAARWPLCTLLML